MTIKASLAALCVSLGVVAALAVTDAQGDPPQGSAATVYVTQTQTVERRIQGKGISWWSAHAVEARREANAARLTASRLSRRARSQAKAFGHAQQSSGLHGTISALLCIHGGEGSWQDSGAPYWGGLQMDSTFQAQYGAWALRRWGTADHWPPEVQLIVGLTAVYSGRGFGPWPNTARACGLL